jgi:hypothetical protein
MEQEIDRDNEQFNQGVTHVVEMLAERIEAPPTWVAGDGSEDYDADLGTTLLNILAAKGLYDRDECTFAGEWLPIEKIPRDGMESFLARFPSGHVAHVYLTHPEPPLAQTFRYFGGPMQGQQAGWPTHWMFKPNDPR